MKPFQKALFWLFRAGFDAFKKHYPYNMVMAVFIVGCGLGYQMGKRHGIIIPVQMAETKILPDTSVQDDVPDTIDDYSKPETHTPITIAELNLKTQELFHSKHARTTDLLRPTEKTLEVKGGDTLVTILTGEGIDRRLAHDVVRSLRNHCDPRRLKPGQTVTLALKPSDDEEQGPELLKVSLKVDETKDVHTSKGDSGKFDAWLEEKEVTKELAYAKVTIDNSLFGASTQAGVPANVVVDVIRALSHRVDLQRDIQPGDQFEIAYERFVDHEGKVVSDGKATFVLLHAKGKDIKLYRHVSKTGENDFYLEDGSSLKNNGFMRTPIDGARLSSSFGMRKHPVHKFTRMHRGVDFAAPRGTPILAAGAGVVTKMGWHGGYGRYIQVKHNGEFATAYAHMNRFAPGLKVGAKVNQGQKIGEVGSTGTATGCHLHYEVLRHGQQINPKSVKNVGSKKLEGRELQQFFACIGKTNTSLVELRTRGTEKLIAHNGIVQDQKKLAHNIENSANSLDKPVLEQASTQDKAEENKSAQIASQENTDDTNKDGENKDDKNKVQTISNQQNPIKADNA
ncbi:MAG: peptidoglycan DD-metalloendopeptidase family protein [Alphaproteobacteria bacterium]|nr:peptidoglycan DD-metalloendopeptidase family protein [Alphaproteobacteria bacterium]